MLPPKIVLLLGMVRESRQPPAPSNMDVILNRQSAIQGTPITQVDGGRVTGATQPSETPKWCVTGGGLNMDAYTLLVTALKPVVPRLKYSGLAIILPLRLMRTVNSMTMTSRRFRKYKTVQCSFGGLSPASLKSA